MSILNLLNVPLNELRALADRYETDYNTLKEEEQKDKALILKQAKKIEALEAENWRLNNENNRLMDLINDLKTQRIDLEANNLLLLERCEKMTNFLKDTLNGKGIPE